MTDYQDVAPTVGDIANTYEFILDVNTGTRQNPIWTNVPDITALNPQPAPKLKDVTTYAHKGATAQKKVGSDFSLSFNLLKIRDANGEFQDEWLALKGAADADGDANNIEFRYYDALGASDAYQGIAAVSRARAGSANDDPEWDTFTMTGVGQVLPIVNPITAPTAPTIMSVAPTGAAATETVYIEGNNLTGATDVTIGGDAATSFEVVHDGLATAVVPTGTAGVVDVIVTNADGASVAYSYERGA